MIIKYKRRINYIVPDLIRKCLAYRDHSFIIIFSDIDIDNIIVEIDIVGS